MLLRAQITREGSLRRERGLRMRGWTGCGRIFSDAPCASDSRDRRAAGYAAGIAGARGRSRHGRLQRDVLLAAWRASSFPGTEHGASFPRGRHGVPSWRVGAHDGVQHEVRATAHGLRFARIVSAGSNVGGSVARSPASITLRQFAFSRRQSVRWILRWSFSTTAQLASSATAEKN